MSYNQDLALGLNAMRKEEKFCDAKLVTPTRSFPCHRVVLSAMSKYFEMMFDSGMMEGTSGEVNLEEDDDAIEAVLTFMYTGRTDINDANVDFLLSIAAEWQISSLSQACVSYLDNHLSTKNCLKVLELAKGLGMKKIEENAKSLIAKEFALVSSSDEFLYLSEVDSVIGILKDKDLNVLSPTTVCKAALKWICEDIENREQYIPKMLASLTDIRIGLDVIQNLATKMPVLCGSQIYQNGIQEMVDQGRDSKTVGVFSDKDDSLVIVGGNDGDSNKKVLCFSFRRKRWYKLPDLPFNPGYNFAMCSFRTSLFISGGTERKAGFTRFSWEINSWVSCQDMPVQRQHHAMICVDLCIYAIGGSEAPSGKPHREIDTFDVKTEQWKEERGLAHLGKPVRSCACAVLDKTIYIFGGFDERNQQCAAIQFYDTKHGVTGHFQQYELPKELRLQTRVVTVNNEIYMITKEGQVLVLDPKQEKLKPVGPIDPDKRKFPRKSFGACDWEDRILIVGGESRLQARKDMLLYKVEEKLLYNMQEELPSPRRDYSYTKYTVPNTILQFEA